MLGFFIGFFTVVLALVCLLMVFIVLMQKPKQEGLGAARLRGLFQMFDEGPHPPQEMVRPAAIARDPRRVVVFILY